MKISNCFFNLREPVGHQIFYNLPRTSLTRIGYSFAEFAAARFTIEHASNQMNWDGYGALGIGNETRRNALGVLSRLENWTCAPEVTQNPNGTLSFEWETNRGFGLLEIGRTRYSFFLQPHSGPAIENSGDVDDVNPAVGLLVDAVLFPKPSNSLTLPTR